MLVVLIAIIASLCFSAGEGLRLTPFGQTSTTGKTVGQVSKHKYGPLDVPTQHQKRNKRHDVQLDFLLTPTTRETPAALQFAAAPEHHEVVSVLVVSQFSGRAPPFVS